MATSELHVQPVVWSYHGERFAALFLEGEAPDRSNDGLRIGRCRRCLQADTRAAHRADR
jgi:hypothetical protein